MHRVNGKKTRQKGRITESKITNEEVLKESFTNHLEMILLRIWEIPGGFNCLDFISGV